MAEENKRRLPARYQTIELDEDYEGWKFEALVSVAMGGYGELLEQAAALDGGDNVTAAEYGKALRVVVEHLRRTIKSWNFVDQEGEDLDIREEESWKILPVELAAKMLNAQMSAIGTPPEGKGDPSPQQSSEEKESPSQS